MLTKERQKRVKRVRAKVMGTARRPRLSVFRSNRKIYAQLVDDTKGSTLAAASGSEETEVGEEIAKLAKTKKIKTVVFDRGGYQYHGRLKALAQAARKGGLEF